MKLLLLDSLSLLNRAFYALPPLTTRDGRPINAVFGYFKMLVKLIKEQKPTHVVAAFDVHAPTFRKVMYAEYKANRKPAPEDLIIQIDLMRELLRALNVSIVEKEGYEADDILGTLSRAADMDTIIVTGDRDSLQLVSDKTHVMLTKVGVSNMIEYDLDRLAEDGLTPEGVIELKAMMGDASDNIPGIRGVGEKTAKNWLTTYGTIDGLYEHIDEIKGKMAEKVIADKEMAYLSRELATINCNVPLEIDFDSYRICYPFPIAAKTKMIEYNFSSMLDTVDFDDTADIAVVDEVEITEINDLDTLTETLTRVSKSDTFAFCIEDDCFTFADSPDQCYRVVCENNFLSPMYLSTTMQAIAPVLSTAQSVIFFNSKSERRQLYVEHGISFGGRILDVSMALYLSNNNINYDTMREYAKSMGCGDGLAAYLVKSYLQVMPIIDGDEQLSRLYYDMELPLCSVLLDMELSGFGVDVGVLKELSARFDAELKALTDSIYALAGRQFNINSTKQLSEVLFQDLELKSGKKTKTGYSSSVEVLEEIKGDHPIIPLILRYRMLYKLNSTYCVGLQSAIEQDGKIRTVFKQNLTNTGRLSSTEPNLQNIPVRTAEGREIRRAFVPSDGNVLVSADYSQIELRLLAHCSGDERLVTAFREGKDIHRHTASLIYNVEESAVTPEMRSASKAVNFGIIYGMSDYGLSVEIGVSVYVARRFIDSYFATYPRVKAYMDSNVEFARENGYVSTIFGRRRDIPEIKSPKYQTRAFGERVAKNMPLQGTAADIIKLAMVKVDQALKTRSPKSKLIMQVHDELIVDCPRNEVDNVSAILRECMENCVSLSVPLTVEIGVGDNWYEAK